MGPQAIRRIDRWCGTPLCAALTFLRRLGSLFRKPPRVAAPTRILIIKMIEQGATVLAYRAIVRAVELVGRENVYFLVFEKNRGILELLDVIPEGNVLAVRDDNPFVFVLDVLCALRTVRRVGIDATVDMEFFARAPAILAFLMGARVRVGLHRFTSEGPYRGDLMTHRIQHNPYLHVAPAYYVLVDAVTADPRERPMPKRRVPAIDWCPPPFRPTESERDHVRDILAAEAGGPVSGQIILLNPNASDMLPLRRWPGERFEELGRRIIRDFPSATIVVTGGPSERAAGLGIAHAIDPARAVCVAGRTSLRELLVLYTIADVLVTNDSGPGHFASLTEIDTLVLFGPETPALFGPVGPHTRAITAGLACSPCVNALNHRFSPCDDNVCMKELTVDLVYAEVVALLSPDRRATRLPVMSLPPDERWRW